MQSLKQIQAMNELATNLIDDGYYYYAFDVLSNAVAKLSGCLLSPSPIDSTQEQHRQDIDVFSSEDEDGEVDHEEDEEEHHEDRITEFYAYPFAFDLHEQLLSSQNQELSNYQYNSIAAVCLFNLGLCGHLAWEEDKSRTDYLLKSGACYQEAISLLSSNCKFIPTGPALKVLLAVCVNAAHCHTELVHLQQVDFWYNILKDLMRLCPNEMW
eukprot:CAMPEP_0198154306 /NCGR_PEP_ID=MMETSP1443-20131203/68107_1 /TAXON_ID=186043 /ORGANISM="Entomoneis sp., Strain CCMP2396" /LENGTH=211 /DNA_ID=CAMNT_0043820955 /DNA_START=21 /DNA_END=653 /DNA_ORIENTATION=+